MILARHFNAGYSEETYIVPQGTAETSSPQLSLALTLNHYGKSRRR
jgi:hypothetical protein